MAGDFGLETERLIQAKRFYEEIRLISVQQKELLGLKNEELWPMETILELLDERQKIMNRIDELDCLLESGSANKPPVVNQEINQVIIEQIRDVIRDIQAIDLICQDRMQKAMPKIMNKLNQTRENKKAQSAYDQGDVYTSAWFFDKKQ